MRDIECGEAVLAHIEADPRHTFFEALAYHVRPDTLAVHAPPKRGIVILAATHFAHPVHDTLRPLRKVRLQPLPE